MATVKIRVSQGTQVNDGQGHVFSEGQVMEVTKAEAEKLIHAGLAEPGSKKAPKAKDK